MIGQAVHQKPYVSVLSSLWLVHVCGARRGHSRPDQRGGVRRTRNWTSSLADSLPGLGLEQVRVEIG